MKKRTICHIRHTTQHRRSTRQVLQQRLQETEQSLAAARRENAELRQHQTIYSTIFDNVPVGLYRSTPVGEIIDMNMAAVEMLGYPSREALLERNALELYVNPDDRLRWQSLLATHGEVNKFEMQFRRYDGSIIWVLNNVRSIHNEAGHLIAYEGSLEDITARKQAELALRASESRYRAIIDAMPDMIFCFGRDGTYLEVHARDEHRLAVSPDQMIGQTIDTMLPPDLAQQVRRTLDELFETGHLQLLEYQLTIEGRPRYFEARCAVSGPNEAIALVRDITERKAHDTQIEHLAFTDPLTGLHNRRRLYEMGEESITTARREGHTMALLYLDLDRFKAFNDTMGHDAGDELLTQVTLRLQEGLSPQGLLARIGGDEFAVLLPNTTAQQATQTAHSLLDCLQRPIELRGQSIYLAGSIGIALGPIEDLPFSMLLTRADIAMYRAKGNRSGVQVYDPSHSTLLPDQMSLETDLRWALATDGLTLHYQPIFDPRSSQIVGAEALVRWHHPTRGLLMPNSFLPLAEDAGLMRILDSWVLETAMNQVAQWYAAGQDWHVAINLTTYSLQHMELITEVSELLAVTGAPPEQIIIELTEQTALHDMETTRQVLDGLRHLGIRIALDDFGNGYASLSNVQHLPVDILKVDRSFTAGIGKEPRDETVVRALLALGSGMDLVVIIEGIERTDQLTWLNGSEGVWVQGYLIGKPAPPEHMQGKQRSNSGLHA
jgi:diguanylate cyclase (GGDEF)-like protein/PAS domain S-box-containing protein